MRTDLQYLLANLLEALRRLQIYVKHFLTRYLVRYAAVSPSKVKEHDAQCVSILRRGYLMRHICIGVGARRQPYSNASDKPIESLFVAFANKTALFD